MMETVRSRPWPDALEVLTGEQSLVAGALLGYFAVLAEWLGEQNSGKGCWW